MVSAVLLLASTACTVPGATVIADFRTMTLVQGQSGSVMVDVIVEPCDPLVPTCLDISGRTFDYVVSGVPDGVSHSIDRSLQSADTPGIARITFDVQNDAPPAFAEVSIVPTVEGRALGDLILRLRIVAAQPLASIGEPIAIAAGSQFSLALLADRRVAAWGTNYSAELGVSGPAFSSLPVISERLDGIVALAAGANHSLALTANGDLWAWGSNDTGALGRRRLRDFEAVTPAIRVDGLGNIQAIAAGNSHSLALGADGAVWMWGDHDRDGHINDFPPEIVRNLPPVRAVAAGDGYSLAVDRDGGVWVWGHVQLAENEGGGSEPFQVAGLSGIESVSASRRGAALALDRNGRVWAWGVNDSGLLGDGTMNDRALPGIVQGLSDVVSIAIGEGIALALTADGTVWHWGPETGTGGLDPVFVPTLAGVTRARAIAASGYHALALLECGVIVSWGTNAEGQLGDGTTLDRNTPQPVARLGSDAGCPSVTLRVWTNGNVPAADLVTAEPGPLEGRSDLSGTYARGTPVTLTARSELLHAGRLFPQRLIFREWSVDCHGSTPQVTVVLDASKHCVASYSSVTTLPALLTVLADGGRVTSSGGGIRGPGAIDCPGVCNVLFPPDTQVALTAAEAAGFEFTEWARDCAGASRQTTIRMDAAKTCQARFRPFQLSVSVAGEGTVTMDPGGLECSSACAFEPRRGAVTLRTQPALGWQFDGWSGDCAGGAAETSVPMDSDRSCTARFVRQPGAFFLTMIVEGDGRVVMQPPGVECGSTCVQLYSAGTTVDLTATPSPNWMISFWLDDCAAPGVPANQIVIDRDKQCRVQFLGRPEFPVAVMTWSPEFPRVGQLVTFDGSASHVFDPVTGAIDFSRITSWNWDFQNDGSIEASGGRAAASIVQQAFQAPGDQQVRLEVEGGRFFAEDDQLGTVSVLPATSPLFGLTVNKAGAGLGTITSQPQGVLRCGTTCTTFGPLLLESGTTLTLQPTPEPDAVFSGWTGCDTVNGNLCAVTLGSNRNVEATFVPAASDPRLTVVIAGTSQIASVIAVSPPSNSIACQASTGGPVCSQTFAPGTVVQIRPSNSTLELLLFDHWTGCDSVGPLATCTVTLTSDRTVTMTLR
jgi:alpha-tubulin suppressor-like RCC1 family protein